MDTKTLNVLEYPKILERLVAFCDFSASMELARRLEPTDSFDLAIARLEARLAMQQTMRDYATMRTAGLF